MMEEKEKSKCQGKKEYVTPKIKEFMHMGDIMKGAKGL